MISREYAKEQKLKTFFTGKPCHNGHLCERYVSNKACLKCSVERCKTKQYTKLKKKWRENNKEKCAEQSKKSYENNKIKCNERAKDWQKNNKDKVKIASHKWKKNNRDKVNKTHKNWRSSNPEYRRIIKVKLRDNIRSRLHIAIKNDFKVGSAVNDLGCSINELKIYIENQFESWMTWENWGRGTWHLDHIRPLAFFNLTNRDQFLEACHFTNLQPLSAEENLRKHSKIDLCTRKLNKYK